MPIPLELVYINSLKNLKTHLIFITCNIGNIIQDPLTLKFLFGK